MTEEIKGNNIPNNVLQALGDLTNGAINYYQLPKTTLEEENIILNYITNLQKENQSLKNQLDFIDEQNKHIDKLEKMIKDYRSRNEKAVEYIKNNALFTETYDYDDEDNLIWNGATDEKESEELLNILQGGDE